MKKITSVEVQKRNQGRVNVFINQEFSFACDAELVYRYDIRKGKSVVEEELKEIIEEEDFIKCKNSALRSLEKAYKTEKEIIDKLKDKGFEEKIIKRTLEFLKEYNLLDDNKYTDMFVKDKIKAQGRNKIKFSLMRKGVCEEVIKARIDNIDVDDELEVATNLAQKKYNVLIKREDDKFKISQKLYRFLASKGYTYECINKAVKNVTNIEDFLE
ncbi:regulatory protein [Clostridium cavendishii DSM 21758]|uniref:Regulatory protein RecX n=1 Tax=Clostridium cavendishii DSM 21758 TaxID=1121302 RepID=A0A1M6A8B8_9CLOT|nr:recombination regulator RecX [Clostridium cavendishii]SHI32715.1 regulatory protein [Clostridium cavendishii DSM 21758]